jgi:hypothetical protein
VEQGLGPLRDGPEVNHGHSAGKLHHFGLHQGLLVVVPLSTLEEQASDVGTVLGWLLEVRHGLGDRDEIEVELVNGRRLVILTRELLQESSGKANGVSEGRDPLDVGHSLRGPGVEELVTVVQVSEPVTKVLEREVST